MVEVLGAVVWCGGFVDGVVWWFCGWCGVVVLWMVWCGGFVDGVVWWFCGWCGVGVLWMVWCGWEGCFGVVWRNLA